MAFQLNKSGVLTALATGNFAQAMEIASKTWISLPAGPGYASGYNQLSYPELGSSVATKFTYQQLQTEYANYGGK